MSLSTLARLSGASLVALSLSACMDVDMNVAVLSQSEAEATMVTAMALDMYQMMIAQAPEGEEEFCAEGELTQTLDTVLCTVVETGAFQDLQFNAAEQGGPMIEAVGGGQVRVSFPTGELADAMAEDTGAQDDPQMQAMIAAMFEGRAITLTVGGGIISDTNMDMAADGKSATYQIPFTSLFAGSADLPAEIFAVVQK